MRFGLELALTFGPVLAVLLLLLRGCYPGEARILARRLRNTARRLRPSRARHPRRSTPIASLLARSALTLRGPPVVA